MFRPDIRVSPHFIDSHKGMVDQVKIDDAQNVIYSGIKEAISLKLLRLTNTNNSIYVSFNEAADYAGVSCRFVDSFLDLRALQALALADGIEILTGDQEFRLKIHYTPFSMFSHDLLEKIKYIVDDELAELLVNHIASANNTTVSKELIKIFEEFNAQRMASFLSRFKESVSEDFSQNNIGSFDAIKITFSILSLFEKFHEDKA